MMQQTTLNCRGRLLDLSTPVVMGILNVTPDSFFDGGRHDDPGHALRQAEKMIREGARIIDVGGASSRPGAETVPEEEELRRVVPLVSQLAAAFPEIILSVDTWRARVAREAAAAGVGILNDISAGRMDDNLYPEVAKSGLPYVLMHMQGTPATMQQAPVYDDVVTEVLDFFIAEIGRLRALGVNDIVLDPGFGFGKTVEHNYRLLNHLSLFTSVTGLPVLAGISRKSMICKVLRVNPENALNGTTALHMVALQQGAKILRAHDVKEAMEVIRLWEAVEAGKTQLS
ncbi:MAG: dihydropteroate synthase [Saprospiraceae bacterium]|nr:dihydropteroate synthase [Saprospiraceae bacterium]